MTVTVIVKSQRGLRFRLEKKAVSQCAAVPFVLVANMQCSDDKRAPDSGLKDHMSRGNANNINWYART
jgi:hypothetical protein